MVFSLRPVFVGWITIVSQLPLLAFLTLWAGAFVGGIVSDGTGTDFLPSAILFGSIAFLIVFLVVYLSKKLNYARTEYKFLDDRLEFVEGFFTHNRKVIRYRDVKEVTLREGILQRTQGLGTIYLATLATGAMPQANPFLSFGFGSFFSSGIQVRDIANPLETFEKVRRLIDEHRSEG